MKKYCIFFIVFTLAGFQISFSQIKSVTGVIKDINGKPVSSATIQVKETNTGTISDSSGLFRLELKPNSLLYVSRVGFADTTINVGGETSVTIVLRYNGTVLNDVSVKSKIYTDPEKTGAINGTANDQKISNGLEDYTKSQANSFGPTLIATNTGDAGNSTWIFSNGPVGNTLYMGGGVPVFSAQKETKGSRYLLEDWGKGSVMINNGDQLNTSSLYFNYDKIGKTLLMTSDKKILIEVNKDSLRSFSVVNPDGQEFKFQRVPQINPGGFYQPLVQSADKYSLYKMLQTKFVKSNYKSDGLVETGTPYDEYVDTYEYYIVMPGNKAFQKLTDLKSKTIKAALSVDAAKVDSYFSQHKREDVNEIFLMGLVDFLNQ